MLEHGLVSAAKLAQILGLSLVDFHSIYLSGDVSLTDHKVVGVDYVTKVVKAHGHKIVFTNGCFDILHAGHCSYLEQARNLGDVLVVGVNSDFSIKRLKGEERPVIPLAQRLKVLGSLWFIDYAIPFAEDTPRRLIEAIRPDVLVKGGDWALDTIVGADTVQSYGGLVTTVESIPSLSTTRIIESIKNKQP